jgi:hypothetical protein
MGTALANRTIAAMPGQIDARLKDLPHQPARVLLAMAVMAHDNGHGDIPAACYFGGWHHLAHALGYPNADNQTAGHRAVARAIEELRQRNLIEPVGRVDESRRKSARIYVLHL